MIHGHSRPPSPTYSSWNAMKTRCRNVNTPDYQHYGARGISYDPKWEDFETFLLDMGKRPAGTTLDRKDPTLGYTKTNCRWATYAEQNRNRAGVKLKPEQVLVIRKWASEGYTQKRIGAYFGISRQHVSRVVREENWRV